MCRALGAAAPLLSLAGWIFTLPALAAYPVADNEIDQFEERAIARSIERGLRSGKSDRALWMKELENAYPGRVVNAISEDDYAGWFALLAGKNEEWRRGAAANTQIAELYDRVVQRLELGPVPTLKRDEFARYARKVLIPCNPPKESRDGKDGKDRKDGKDGSGPNEDADRVFRVLDRDGNGSLSKDELSLRLRDDRLRVDTDGNGLIERDEYRRYFQSRVSLAIDTASAKGDEKGTRTAAGKANGSAAKAALPAWFTSLDIDMDGQIALHEWRKAGRSIEAFQEMDLDNDGLLTRDDYLRFVRKSEAQRAKAANPPPQGKVAKMEIKKP